MRADCANSITLLALTVLSVTPVFAEQVAQLVDASGSVTMKILQLAPKTLSKGKCVENGVIVTTGDEAQGCRRKHEENR